MRALIRIVSIGLAVGLFAGSAHAEEDAPEVSPIDALIESVRNSSERRREEIRRREEAFIAERDKRRQLLDEVRRARIAAEQEADRLAAEFERGEQELSDLETRLDQETGDLADVFASVHQISSDALPMMESSLVTAQLGDRSELLVRLGNKDVTPNVEDMRALWLMFLDEMNESGKTSRFVAPVISASGEEVEREVVRIGTFTILSEGEYLRYLPNTGQLLALNRQPVGVSLDDLRAFQEASEEMVTVALDPSRGSILALVVQRAGLGEQIEQGGVIGFIILLLGAFGLLLGLERLIVIFLAHRRLTAELADASVANGGPIGQLRRAVNDTALSRNTDALSAKLDEIITTANQKLNRGLPTLAILAAVSPLLGLLGTVTGMIETFQVITLFGAGDPRLMSGGISQALITTQLGLSVAIPLLLLHSFVQGRANTQVATLDEVAASMFAEGQRARETSDD